MKKKAVLAIALVCTMIPGMTCLADGTSTPATTTSEQTINDASTASANVTVTGHESTFEVTLPKTIVADADRDTGDLSVNYTISVTGDISGTEYVEVLPDASFTLSQSNKANIIASVSQSKTAFRDSTYSGTLGTTEVKMGSDVTGSISAAGLSAGEWTGVLNFSIALK